MAATQSLTFVIEEARNVLIWGRMLNWAGWGLSLIVGMAIAWGGWWFQKARKRFGDVL
jgi:lipopolysaccharide transport system permease protein